MAIALALVTLLLQGIGCAAPTYPDDAFSSPPADRWDAFETLTGVQPPGNPVSRMTQYELNELRAVTRHGKPWARWRFICRPGHGAVLCFSERIRRMPRLVRVRIANRGERPATFAVSMAEMPWVPGTEGETLNWAVNADGPLSPGEERVVRFDLSELRPNTEADRSVPRWPTTINLHVGGPQGGVLYALELREWTVLYAPAEGITVDSLTVPSPLRPGEQAVFTLQTEGVTADTVADVEVRHGRRVLWRTRLTADETRALAQTGGLELKRQTPWYLPPRTLSAGLVVDGYRAEGAEASVEVAPARPSTFPRAERRVHNGRPTVFVEGKPMSWSGYSSYEYQPANVSEFGAAGANMFVVPVAAGRHVHQIAEPTWVSPDTFDFGQVDERVCMSLQANPQAYLLLRVSLALPSFWLQEHPDSIVRVRTREGDTPGREAQWEETGTLAASIASPEWQDQQEACLRALIEHCAKQPWAGRVIGFFPTGEVTEEWFAWGCNDGLFADYSPANQEAFARWCQNHSYPWTSVPEPRSRQRPGWDYYPPDAAGQQSAAYAQYYSELTAEVIARFARLIKQATGNRCLTGTFYGYLLQLAGEPRQHLAGQFALRRLIDCPQLDFFAGIPLHNFRSLTAGYDLYTSATESILAAGKLYVNENDLFSWLHHALWTTAYDPADPRGGAISMHRRVLANDMVHGAPRQWFSLLSSWHHDRDLMAEFARQIALQSMGLQYDRSGVEQIAFVVDDTSFAWLPPESALHRATHAGLLYALGRTGAPVGVWLLRDLDRLPERIKLIVVAEATAALPEDIDKLRGLLRVGGRTIVVVGAPGLIDPISQNWDARAPAQLTGLPIQVNDAGGLGDATVTETGHAACSLGQVRPIATGDGEAWMRLADGGAAGLERDLPNGGTLIWCSVPPQTNAVTLRWLGHAGVHRYAPADYTVHASEGLVAITASQAGIVALQWPNAVRVRDLYDGWQAQGAAFTCPFAAGQTRLFAVEST